MRNSKQTKSARTVAYRQRGFSLIELLIVIGILLIIAAIAVPSFLRARIAANEAATAQSLRAIVTSNTVYNSIYQQGYAGTLAQMGPPSGACPVANSACSDLLDSAISGVNPLSPFPIKAGYQFTYIAPNAAPTPATQNYTWSTVSTPISPGSSGKSTFCTDQAGTIRKDTSGGLTTAATTGCTPAWSSGGTVGPL